MGIVLYESLKRKLTFEGIKSNTPYKLVKKQIKISFSELTLFLKEIRLNIVLKTDRKLYILRRMVLLSHF